MGCAERWVCCGAGHRHWGLHGAAGLLLRAPAPGAGASGGGLVLLQLRAGWTHHGGTWGLPGGARLAGESAAAAARREAVEEVRLELTGLALHGTFCDDHGGWSYTTVLATIPRAVPVQPRGAEGAAVAWVGAREVTALPLHPGLAGSWPTLSSFAGGD